MKKLSFTLIFSLISTLTFACSCSWTNFLKASKNSELIIKAKVLKHNYYLSNGKLTDLTNVDSLDYSGHSITVELTEIIKGTEKRNIFEIYGGNGWDCRPPLQNFEINKAYVFSIFKTERTNWSQTQEDNKDFSLYSCSEFFIEYFPETNEIRGRLKGRKSSIKKRIWSYDKFLKKIT
jgi:hypothetical protein